MPVERDDEKHLDDFDKKIVLMLADCNMQVSEVARQMFMHRNSIVYHINKIKRITGKDPQNFYDLCDLVQNFRGYR